MRARDGARFVFANQMTAFSRSLAPVLNVLGAVVAIFAITMLVPLGVAFFADEEVLVPFTPAFWRK